MSRGTLSGEFVGAPGRRVFVLWREPDHAARATGSVLVVPPFGEEMNKSRRMIAEASMCLGASGVPVVVPDFFGTGDSEGDFRAASVDGWLEDLDSVCRHAERRGLPVRAVLAVRLGCTLAVAGARAGALPSVAASVWWQPVLDGRRFLTQFLRLRVAAGSLRGGAPETVDGLRQQSAAGETITVAGYELSPALVEGVDRLALDTVPQPCGDVTWFEFVREPGAAPPLPTTRFIEKARAAGVPVALEPVAGEPFWASAEIVRLPSVIERTAALLGAVPGLDARRPTAATQASG